MTPEERFARIELNLERLEGSLTNLAIQVDKHDRRLQQLTEFQAVLMESQTSTWAAIATLTQNIEKLLRLGGSNGHSQE